MSTPNGGKPTRINLPPRVSHHSWSTGHGLEVITGPDIARIALPEASATNVPLLDAAAGHVCVLGAPPNEYTCLTMGIRLVGGQWQYESGVSTARVIRIDPGGQVNFYLVTGTPMVWSLQAWLDAAGSLVVGGNLQVNGAFQPSGPLTGGGPAGTVLLKRAAAKMFMSYTYYSGTSSWVYVPFDRLQWDTAGLGGKVASQFLLPMAGFYTFNAVVTFGGPSNRLPNTCGIRILVADAPVMGGQTGRSDPDFPLTLSTSLTAYCGANDTAGVQFYLTDYPDTIVGSNWAGHSFFEVIFEGQ